MEVNDRFFVVVMNRYGNSFNHSYVGGVFSSLELAEKKSAELREDKGNTKYFPEIIPCTLNVFRGSEDIYCGEGSREIADTDFCTFITDEDIGGES